MGMRNGSWRRKRLRDIGVGHGYGHGEEVGAVGVALTPLQRAIIVDTEAWGGELGGKYVGVRE